MHAGIEFDFAVVREREVFLQGAENEPEVVGRERGRRAAAEVDGMDGISVLRGLVRPHLDFAHELLRIFMDRFFLEGVLIEHAVKAPRFAERHVDVSQGLRGAGGVGKFKETLSRVFAEKRHSAGSRVNGSLRLEGIVKGIFGVREEGFGCTGFHRFIHFSRSSLEGGGRLGGCTGRMIHHD